MSKENTHAGGEQGKLPQPRSQLDAGMLAFEYAEWFNLTKCGLIVPYVPFVRF